MMMNDGQSKAEDEVASIPQQPPQQEDPEGW